MEQLTDLLIEVVLPLVVTIVLGAAVPVLQEKKRQLKAGKNEVLIRILEAAIDSGIDYFRQNNQKPTVDGIAAYVKGSIPDTLNSINTTENSLERKIIARAGGYLITGAGANSVSAKPLQK